MERKSRAVLLKKEWPEHPPMPGMASPEVSENVFLFAKTLSRVRKWLRRRRQIRTLRRAGVGEAVRILHHHESDGWWAESPDVKGWSAAGDSFREVVRLAEEGIPSALGRGAKLEHYVPAAE